MALEDFRIDYEGVGEVLNSAPVRTAINGLAGEILNNVIAQLPEGTDVVADSYTTDRAAASVTIRDVRGRAWQARDGVLTRAAAAVGLEVTETVLYHRTQAGRLRRASSAQITYWTRGAS